MEPMNLGSPVGSPISMNNQSAYLPSFLLGDSQAATTPRSNTLSPKGTGRAFGCVNSAGTSGDFNRSVLAPNAHHASYQQQQAQHHGNAPQSLNGSGVLGISNYPSTPTRNASHQTGPPIQSLFDSLRNDRNQVLTPSRGLAHHQSSANQQHTPLSVANFNLDQSYQPMTQFNDSYAPTAPNAFNASMRGLCSPLGANMSPLQLSTQRSDYYADFWVTVFGFPPGATSMILEHFTLCGTIVDKILAPQNGNWMHVKFASRMECDKALNYNQKIISNNIMVGVTRCMDRSIIDKENDNINQQQMDRSVDYNESLTKSKVRPLAHQAYNNAISDTAVSPNKALPQRSNGIVNKAIDLFFSW